MALLCLVRRDTDDLIITLVPSVVLRFRFNVAIKPRKHFTKAVRRHPHGGEQGKSHDPLTPDQMRSMLKALR